MIHLTIDGFVFPNMESYSATDVPSADINFMKQPQTYSGSRLINMFLNRGALLTDFKARIGLVYKTVLFGQVLSWRNP